jgi:Zn-dependent protease with chaperone function
MIAGVLGYRYGLPLFAERACERPAGVDVECRELRDGARARQHHFFEDQSFRRPQATLLRRFDDLVLPDHRRLTLEFRDAESLGANAMALPSGAIYMTDQLVALTSDDRVLMAVIAHEAGHVKRRHGLRQMIQGATVGALITWYFGDFSALGAAAPASLLQAKYSRDLEREADAYAVQVLKMNDLPASLLADALELIQKSHGPAGKDDRGRARVPLHAPGHVRAAGLAQMSQ